MQITLLPPEARYIMAAALFAAPNDVTPVLTGVQLETEDGALRILSSDRKVAYHALVDADGAEAGTSALVPAKAVADAVRTLLKTKEPIILTIEGSSWSLSAGGQTFTGATIDGNFPPLRRLFPQEVGSISAAKWDTATLVKLEKAAAALGASTSQRHWLLAGSHSGSTPQLVASHASATVLCQAYRWSPSQQNVPDGTPLGVGIDVTFRT